MTSTPINNEKINEPTIFNQNLNEVPENKLLNEPQVEKSHPVEKKPPQTLFQEIDFEKMLEDPNLTPEQLDALMERITEIKSEKLIETVDIGILELSVKSEEGEKLATLKNTEIELKNNESNLEKTKIDHKLNALNEDDFNLFLNLQNNAALKFKSTFYFDKQADGGYLALPFNLENLMNVKEFSDGKIAAVLDGKFHIPNEMREELENAPYIQDDKGHLLDPTKFITMSTEQREVFNRAFIDYQTAKVKLSNHHQAMAFFKAEAGKESPAAQESELAKNLEDSIDRHFTPLNVMLGRGEGKDKIQGTRNFIESLQILIKYMDAKKLLSKERFQVELISQEMHRLDQFREKKDQEKQELKDRIVKEDIEKRTIKQNELKSSQKNDEILADQLKNKIIQSLNINEEQFNALAQDLLKLSDADIKNGNQVIEVFTRHVTKWSGESEILIESALAKKSLIIRYLGMVR